MRRLAVFLALIALLTVSLALAWVATGWPDWCRLMHWCDGQGML